jgi:aspartate racemase
MKTIGLIGGMSWESSLEYYRIINESVRDALGGLHSAQCLMYSVDFAEIEVLQHEGRWDEAADRLIDAAHRLERGGADFVVLCTNTMHKLADAMMASMSIPLLHIADATAEQIVKRGINTIGLLGTRFTMEENFYKGRLIERYGLKVLIPLVDERAVVHRVIYEELVLGQIKPASREGYAQVIEGMVTRGAEGIILGCTEIGMLVHDEDSSVPLFDTTRIHAIAAVKLAL